MPLSDVLSESRVVVSGDSEGQVRDKMSALRRLAALLASGQELVTDDDIFRVLTEREQLQSTGVGGGVAVPHGCVAHLDRQIAALLVCPQPIPFDAIDGEPVSILFALVGPKGAPAQHLKILAQMSRLLRDGTFREQLSSATVGRDAFALIESRESRQR